MKIYFSQAPESDVLAMGADGVFVTENNEYFYNYLEFGTNAGGLEEVAIVDGCDRSVPLCVGDIPDLIAALTEVYNIANEIAIAEKVQAYAESDTEQYVYDQQVTTNCESVQGCAGCFN